MAELEKYCFVRFDGDNLFQVHSFTEKMVNIFIWGNSQRHLMPFNIEDVREIFTFIDGLMRFDLNIHTNIILCRAVIGETEDLRILKQWLKYK